MVLCSSRQDKVVELGELGLFLTHSRLLIPAGDPGAEHSPMLRLALPVRPGMARQIYLGQARSGLVSGLPRPSCPVLPRLASPAQPQTDRYPHTPFHIPPGRAFFLPPLVLRDASRPLSHGQEETSQPASQTVSQSASPPPDNLYTFQVDHMDLLRDKCHASEASTCSSPDAGAGVGPGASAGQPHAAHSSQATRSRADRPCDTCRKRKSRCVKEPGQDKCVLCSFHRRACTYLDEPQRRKRPKADSLASISSTPEHRRQSSDP